LAVGKGFTDGGSAVAKQTTTLPKTQTR